MPRQEPQKDPEDLLGDDTAPLAGAVYANNFRSLRVTAAASGFRTHPFRYEAVRESTCNRVAEEFLVNSRLLRTDAEFGVSVGEYFTETGQVMTSLLGREGRLGTRSVPLPETLPLPMSFGEAVRRRRSVRVYTGDRMPLSHLGAILWAGSGITGRASGGTTDLPLALRSTPSGGALYPIDVHVVALRTEGLSRGVYLYDPVGARLWETAGDDVVSHLLGALAVPEDAITASQATALCLLVGRAWRTMRKYGARGMRHMFLEAGAMAEQMNLAIVALGLGSVDCSGIYDDEVHEVLGVDGVYEALLHCIVVGVPA